MKNLLLIAKQFVQRRDSENACGPIFRVWFVSIVLYAVFISAFQLFFTSDILIRECLYAWLASVPITFVGMVGSYAMIGAMHGRLGFRRSRMQWVRLSVATAAVFGTGFFVASAATPAFLPPMYLVIVAVVVPVLQLLVAATAGNRVANVLESIAVPNGG